MNFPALRVQGSGPLSVTGLKKAGCQELCVAQVAAAILLLEHVHYQLYRDYVQIVPGLCRDVRIT